MKHYEKATITTEKLVAVFCNVCGEQIVNNEYGYLDNYVTIEKKWGYGSKHDGSVHSIDICDKCYDKMISAFTIPISENTQE